MQLLLSWCRACIVPTSSSNYVNDRVWTHWIRSIVYCCSTGYSLLVFKVIRGCLAVTYLGPFSLQRRWSCWSTSFCSFTVQTCNSDWSGTDSSPLGVQHRLLYSSTGKNEI